MGMDREVLGIFLSCHLSNLVELMCWAPSHGSVSTHPLMVHGRGWRCKETKIFIGTFVSNIKFHLFCKLSS